MIQPGNHNVSTVLSPGEKDWENEKVPLRCLKLGSLKEGEAKYYATLKNLDYNILTLQYERRKNDFNYSFSVHFSLLQCFKTLGNKK